MLDRVMKFTKIHLIFLVVIVLSISSLGVLGFAYRQGFLSEGLLVRVGGGEGFRDLDSYSKAPVCGGCKKPKPCGCKNSDNSDSRACNECNKPKPCACDKNGNLDALKGLFSKTQPAPIAPCPRVVEPDLSKYILKTQVPVCSKTKSVMMPEMTNYMLKTECPPVPDLSKYVLKSSIPKPQPVIIDNSSCKKDAGECPPCPRPRCPTVTCPAPTKCPPPAPCPRPVCPPTVVKCKSEEVNQPTVRPFLAPLNMGSFGSA